VFVLLLAVDARDMIELWGLILAPELHVLLGPRFGGALFWGAFAVVVLFDAGLIWLTIHVGKRIRAGFASRLVNAS
jgi:hypothetical protein